MVLERGGYDGCYCGDGGSNVKPSKVKIGWGFGWVVRIDILPADGIDRLPKNEQNISLNFLFSQELTKKDYF